MNLLSEIMRAFSEQYRGIVYHYTSAEGIAGIISNHEIWMSNTAFMNDTTELRTLQKDPSILKDSDFTNEHVKRAWHNMPEREYDTNYYMASFSKVKDMLEQWRAYGSYCIGFNSKELCLRKNVALYRCLYTARDISKWILRGERNKEWWKQNINELLAFSLIYIASMKYKNAHFKNEKEVRLITVSNHNWSNNNSPKMYEHDFPIHVRRHPVYGFPIPYVKFFIEQDSTGHAEGLKEKETEMKARKLKEEGTKVRKLLPITEVIVGPIAYQKESKAACEILLADRGYKNVKVNVSSIPYRGL